jgi:hypothetical protein
VVVVAGGSVTAGAAVVAGLLTVVVLRESDGVLELPTIRMGKHNSMTITRTNIFLMSLLLFFQYDDLRHALRAIE